MDSNILFEKVLHNSEGIQLDLLTDSFKIFAEDFICAICDKLVVKPLFCKNCSRVFCSYCQEKTGKENCISCTLSSLEPCPNITLNLLGKFVIKCRNERCKKMVCYSKYFLHLEACDENLYKCNKCEYEDKRVEIEKHVKECDGIKVNCEFCQTKVLRRNYKDHISNCFSNSSSPTIDKKELQSEIDSLKERLNSLQNTNNLLSDKHRELLDKYNSLLLEMDKISREKQDLIKEINNYKLGSKVTVEEEKEPFIIKSIECSFCSSKSRTLQKVSSVFSVCAKCKVLNRTCMCLFCSQFSKAISQKSEKSEESQELCNFTNGKSTMVSTVDKNKPVKEIKLLHQKCEKCMKSFCTCESRKNQRMISSCEGEICQDSQYNNHVDLKPKEFILGTSNGVMIKIDILRSKIESESKIHLKKINGIFQNNKEILSISSDGFIKRFKENCYNSIVSEYSNNGDGLSSSIILDESQFLCGYEARSSVGLYELENDKIKLTKEFTKDINSPIQSICRLTNDLFLLGEKQSMNGKILFLNVNKNMVQFGIETGTETTVNNILKLKYSFSSNFISSNTNGVIKLWDMKSKLVQNHEVDSSSCIESKIIQSTDERIIFSCIDNSIKLLDLKSKQICSEALVYHKSPVLDLCLFDSFLLASCSKDSTVALWDLRKNQVISKLELPKEYYANVLFRFTE